MKIKEITDYLEGLAPLSTQEDYDNCGLLVGSHNDSVSSILICLDSTPEIVDEAIEKGCDMIIAHHPIIFKGLKKLNGKNYIEQTVIKCIKHGIALYAIHTNLDNYLHGVNRDIGIRLGLENLKILRPKQNGLFKLVVYTPVEAEENLITALFNAGAGNIGNYSECSFSTEGIGTFKPNEGSNPFSGDIGNRSSDKERKLEFLVEHSILDKVLAVMNDFHPYEEVAHDIIQLGNKNQHLGSGMIGELSVPLDEMDFLKKVKNTFGCGAIRYTELKGGKIKKVAFCGGSGSFLLQDAIRQGADIFITGDFKYHEFFDSEKKIVIADIGHYESEQFTINLLGDILKKKFATFAVRLTEINTNPINYI